MAVKALNCNDFTPLGQLLGQSVQVGEALNLNK